MTIYGKAAIVRGGAGGGGGSSEFYTGIEFQLHSDRGKQKIVT